MFKLVLACAVLAAASADVSHIIDPTVLNPLVGRVLTGRSLRAVPVVQPAVQSVVQPRVASYHVAPAILRQTSDVTPDGGYQYAYDTENGISAQEQGSVKVLGPEEGENYVQGTYSYTSPEGEQVSVSYVADANGFQPTGSHIPPVPVAIQKALEYIRAHPQPQDVVQKY